MQSRCRLSLQLSINDMWIKRMCSTARCKHGIWKKKIDKKQKNRKAAGRTKEILGRWPDFCTMPKAIQDCSQMYEVIMHFTLASVNVKHGIKLILQKDMTFKTALGIVMISWMYISVNVGILRAVGSAIFERFWEHFARVTISKITKNISLNFNFGERCDNAPRQRKWFWEAM